MWDAIEKMESSEKSQFDEIEAAERLIKLKFALIEERRRLNRSGLHNSEAWNNNRPLYIGRNYYGGGTNDQLPRDSRKCDFSS